MNLNYDILATILKYSTNTGHVTFKTKNDVNGNNKKIVVYNDMTFIEPNPSHEFDHILISNMSTRELSKLKKSLITFGLKERQGGEN